jgi:hypothetical protein
MDEQDTYRRLIRPAPAEMCEIYWATCNANGPYLSDLMIQELLMENFWTLGEFKKVLDDYNAGM